MSMGAGGNVMLGAIGQRVQPHNDYWVDLLAPFKELRLPDRGKYAGRLMVQVALTYPKYIVFVYEKAHGRMGVPDELYDLCADAVVGQTTLEATCRHRAEGVQPTMGQRRHHGNLVPRFHMFKNPEHVPMYAVDNRDNKTFEAPLNLPTHPNCRSSISFVHATTKTAYDWEPAAYQQDQEPSFLDAAEACEPDTGSFLDGIL